MACIVTCSVAVASPAAAGRRTPNARAALAGTPLRMSQPSVRNMQATAIRAAAATQESMGADTWNNTYYPLGEDITNVDKQWYIIDAEGQTLGRLATLAATHIRGKNSPTYTPSQDMGNYVVVINAEKVVVTGNKKTQKKYFSHPTSKPGSWKLESFENLQKRIPERIIEKAVWGMLPKGRMGREIFHHLKVFKGPAHPHEAQQPIDITVNINGKAGKGL